MNISTCPLCRAAISQSALSCPSRGHPLSTATPKPPVLVQYPANLKPNATGRRLGSLVFYVAVASLLGWLFFFTVPGRIVLDGMGLATGLTSLPLPQPQVMDFRIEAPSGYPYEILYLSIENRGASGEVVAVAQQGSRQAKNKVYILEGHCRELKVELVGFTKEPIEHRVLAAHAVASD